MWKCSKNKRCDCHIWSATINHRTREGTGCPYCKGSTKVCSHYNFATEFPYLALEWHPNNERKPEEYSYGSESRVLWKCLVGSFEHVWEATINSRTNMNSGCPVCRQSHGEKRICNYLRKTNIPFETEKIFVDLRYIKKLRCDFYIISLNLVVEYDGIQHDEPVYHFGGEEEFEKTLERDKIKNNYCLERGLNLLRIKYHQFSKIENIIDETITKIVAGEMVFIV